jgi:26S proteasome regulatory subunit N6
MDVVAMEVEAPAALLTNPSAADLHDAHVVEDADDEDITGLEDRYEEIKNSTKASSEEKVKALQLLLDDDTYNTGPKAIQLKERIVYDLTRLLCQLEDTGGILTLVTDGFLVTKLSKAKTAKVVRQVLDIVCSLSAPLLQEQVASSILKWCVDEKRSFLRQRVESRLAAIYFAQGRYVDSMKLCDALLQELKKLDDKQLLVETHLLESKIYFALHNVPKSKAALTASRTAANAIYVSPTLQSEMDVMSGTLHTEEGDYNTGHSYFLEAFEQLDQMGDVTAATTALKYMMLCRILDSLKKALASSSATKNDSSASASSKSSSSKGVTLPPTSAAGTSSAVDLTSLLSPKQHLKYSGRDIQALQAIAQAASDRNLKEYEQVLKDYDAELRSDLLIKHHLQVLQSNLLESNLIRVIEPYEVVQIEYVASKMQMPLQEVERKCSQMILDGKLSGILDQGSGHLIVYEDPPGDASMEKGLAVIANMDSAVSSLFERSNKLRTMMM